MEKNAHLNDERVEDKKYSEYVSIKAKEMKEKEEK